MVEKIKETKELSYERNILYQQDSFEVVAVNWNSESVSEFHNHGWSQCMVLIESGIFENTTDLGFKTEKQLLEAGQVLNTPPGAKHEMRCLSALGKTLHVYTPKIIENNDLAVFSATTTTALRKDLQLSEATRTDQLRKILDEIVNQSISTHSPYFMNQLFSGVLPQMLMAEDVIAKTKTTLATYEASPTFSVIESEVIESLGAVINWPVGLRDGVCVPGGSAANFMALHCARQKMFPDIKQKGMQGKQFKILVSSEAHYSFKKACAAMGFGTDALVAVPTDATDALSKL